MRVLDLCSGLGGWSNVWRERGHEVLTVDIVPPADIIGDVRSNPVPAQHWDVILASPPCTEFSREFMPWHRSGAAPDLSVVQACRSYAEMCQPRVFILENVIGAQKWIGKAAAHFGSRYLWGWFPSISCEDGDDLYGKWRLSPSRDRARIRSLIPPRLALAVYEACTRTADFSARGSFDT